MTTRQEKINSCMRLTSNQFRRDFNTVRLNTHNKLEHELAKCKLAYELIKDGHEILTEVIFKDTKGRADIVDLCCFGVYEILCSEKEKEALTKESYYPDALDIHLKLSKEVLK